jgi:uncharacterized protein (TIGR02444 family)
MFKIIPDAFWEYSLSVYQHNEVKDACLLLQDRMDLNVNVILSMMYLCKHDRMYHFEDIEKLEADILPSEKNLKRHRAIRRDLKNINDLRYRQALSEELALEKEQQELITRYANTLTFNAYGEPGQLSDQLVALCMRQTMHAQTKSLTITNEDLNACKTLAKYVERDWNYR